MVEITPAEQIRLNLFSTLNCDTAAAAKAIEFVQDSPLKYQLFIQQYNRVTTESEVVTQTIKAVQESTEALALFDTIAEQAS
ncbi:Protein of uncharacterised function (DUF2560) [Klebsiella pneumoniae]|jgi:hypothetical protein|uniref:DUF2560 family protein n=1 Tax=Klebsiella pneumoniae TaxID=573 RepID=UPI000E2C15C7|nr:DUF2560 family protein [Klebsiella pneumoniae]MCQ0886337.1 DUF2560 family protein [Klebsiella pneumoniae]SYD77181.1 Protein of uncharacterised function (DUF2560) [Klebsiella pneumoniae]VVK11639.1 Protein of uncharacterised function (DUF2560) [Klebsiella pneumoniae]VVK55371.1 Protein of uncharacterised function (DUF2560) [Klebsiella pneumoniae]HBQ1920705.1 DUF2560 family protein [Klebsiella pneumoniae]